MKKWAIAIASAVLAQGATSQDADHAHGNHGAAEYPVTTGNAVDSNSGMHDMGGMGDMGTDPWLHYVELEQFEWRNADENSIMAWDVSAWSGNSLHKLWLNAEGERVRGHTEHAEMQLLYGRAISSYWDVQAGVRSDIDPQPDQHWATIGLRGLAPFFFDINAQLYVADDGRTAARFSAEYELMLTQKLVLIPDIELNAYGKDDSERGIGSGLSSFEAGLRLRYEIVREFAPYVGVTHERTLGDTANTVEADGDERSETMLVIGISAWL